MLVSPVLAQDKGTVVGSGKVVSETRKLAQFDEIEFRIASDLHLTIGKPTPLEIKADDNILPLIKTVVTAGRLVISAERNFKTEHTPNLHITVADLKSAELCGSGDVHIRGIDNKRLALAIKGSGDLHFDGQTGQLAISIAGSGDAQLTGKADNLTVSIRGSGDVQAFGFGARQAAVAIKGSGDAKVSVSDTLSVHIAGSGDVHYKGNPQVVQQIQGSGDVKRHR